MITKICNVINFFIFFVIVNLVGCQGKMSTEKSNASADSTKHTLNTALDESTRVRGTCVIRSGMVVRLKAQVAGEVKTVLAERGNLVHRGQVLVTMDIADLNLRKARTQIEFDKLVQRAELLRFQITRAEKEFSVVQDLSGTVGTYLPRYGKEMAVLVERKSDLRENELNQALNRLDLQTIEDQIQKSAVRSPLDGVVLARTVEPGMVIGSGSQTIGGGEVLFEVADPTKLIAACIVKESDALRLERGRIASVWVDGANSKSIITKIRDVSPFISSDSGISRREFHVDLDGNLAKGLLPGMNAEVTIGG